MRTLITISAAIIALAAPAQALGHAQRLALVPY